jgi:hypothetical protein
MRLTIAYSKFIASSLNVPLILAAYILGSLTKRLGEPNLVDVQLIGILRALLSPSLLTQLLEYIKTT